MRVCACACARVCARLCEFHPVPQAAVCCPFKLCVGYVLYSHYTLVFGCLCLCVRVWRGWVRLCVCMCVCVCVRARFYCDLAV